jgi:hypothetical protein
MSAKQQLLSLIENLYEDVRAIERHGDCREIAESLTTDCLVTDPPIEPIDDWHWDHEPPLAWRERHPEFAGWHVKRRAHATCNFRKGDRWAA